MQKFHEFIISDKKLIQKENCINLLGGLCSTKMDTHEWAALKIDILFLVIIPQGSISEHYLIFFTKKTTREPIACKNYLKDHEKKHC